MSINKKIKVMTILGTRPEIIRLSIIIKKMDVIFDHILVNTKQNFSENMNEYFFSDLNIRKPDIFLNVDEKNQGHIIANVISQSYDVLKENKPDCLLILGDTNSALSAIAAKRLKIPIFHLEAGNRSFDLNLPEEVNRRIVDEISDINIVYSERARQNLIDEGKPSRWIFKIGSPLWEVFYENKEKIDSSNILEHLNLKKNDYILLSIHRDENVNDKNKLLKLFENIDYISKIFNKKIICSLHPKTKKIIEENNINISNNIKTFDAFRIFDYCKLQINSFCVISDSGSLAEESFILKFKSISLRNSTERQESFEFNNNFILANLEKETIEQSLNAIFYLSNNSVDYCDYNIKYSSNVIIKLIQSYTPIIKRKYNS